MALATNLKIAVAAVAAMTAGFWLSSMLNKADDQTSLDHAGNQASENALTEARNAYSPIQGSIITPPRKISIPALFRDDGAVFSSADVTGHWSLFFFGYTNCPDICPVTMGVVSQAKKIALAENRVFPEVFFISVDPDRDKIEMLGDYVRYFDNDFIGVTGDEDLIKALTLQMSVVYMKMPVDNKTSEAGNYLVDHSSALLLLNPEGRLVALLNPPHDPATIANDIEKVIGLQ